jgi:hypothetical protein
MGDATARLNERPSDDELGAYLLETIRMSPIAWSVPDSEFDSEKLDPGFVASLRAFAALPSGAAFLAKVREVLHDALRRLDAVSRDDPFWEGRNLRPTLYKLRDYNARIISKNPDDAEALWTQAALYILHGSTNFGQKQWRRLHYVGRFDVAWPILAALVTELNAGPTGDALVELVDRIEVVDEAKSFLQSLDATGDPWIIGWRDDVLAALEP